MIKLNKEEYDYLKFISISSYNFGFIIIYFPPQFLQFFVNIAP